MDYKIVQREAFSVIGKVVKLSTSCGEHNMKIAEFWGECNCDGTSEKISAIDSRQSMLGVCLEFDDDSGLFGDLKRLQ